MASRSYSTSLTVFLAAFLASSAAGQVTFNFTYQDIAGAGAGFNDTTIDAGETLTRGQLRQNTVTAVANYMTTVFDGRGTTQLQWNTSGTIGGSTLAQFG